MRTPPCARKANTATEQDFAKVRRIYTSHMKYMYTYTKRPVAVACREQLYMHTHRVMQVLRANVDCLEGFMTTDVDKLADRYGDFVIYVLELTPRLNLQQLRKAVKKGIRSVGCGCASVGPCGSSSREYGAYEVTLDDVGEKAVAETL